MSPATREIAVRALRAYIGDDLFRCERAFVAFLPKEMDEQHGESGMTRRQVLDGYRAHYDACVLAIVEIERAP